jgi:hypothetical protein
MEQQGERPVQNSNVVIALDCIACRSASSMQASAIPKFGGVLRLIGYIIATPSALGVALAALIAVVSVFSPRGNAASGMLGLGFAVFVACASLVGGLVGWFFLGKRRAFVCGQCGYVMDRA